MAQKNEARLKTRNGRQQAEDDKQTLTVIKAASPFRAHSPQLNARVDARMRRRALDSHA
jgi:hypothetical protein